jgi:hypothetical protein
MNKAELLEKINAGWDEFQTYVATLSPADFTSNIDAAGWTVKDHMMHLAVWEDGIRALLDGQSRHHHMGLDDTTWETGDFDMMNAVIQQQHRDKPLDEVLAALRDAHTGLMAKLDTLSNDDLQRPYNTYQPDPKRVDPVINWIEGDTYAHYAAHQPWIAAIVAGS